MVLLNKYEDFVNRVKELGFMPLSNILTGLPSLTKETSKEIWHTGDPDTDPWCWKDRVAEEKKLAFGCILGGHKGFVSARMYPMFYAAFHPAESIAERRSAGQVSQTVWLVWQLFEKKSLLNTSEIRKEMGVTRKNGSSKVDKAVTELQQFYYITVAGSRRKLDKYGQPYGWPANVYNKVENVIPAEWLRESAVLTREEARERILDEGTAISKNIKRMDLAKMLGMKKV